MLAGKNLRKSLGGTDVLHGIDIDVVPGRATILIGPNGAGKSVLLRCLALTDPPDSGVVQVGEMRYVFPGSIPSANRPWPGITACFQQLFLWPHLTIRQNVELTFKNPKASPKGPGLVSEFGERLKIIHLLDRYPNECSLGQRQRAALLRALVVEPYFLLCDEITSALDVEAAYAVIEIINELKSRGVGILLITHQLGLASQLADEVIFMEEGHVVEMGKKSILMTPRSDRMKRFLSIVELVQGAN